ncbi:MAG: hypothetical protein AAF828_07935 [Bacteroidota bacterium]
MTAFQASDYGSPAAQLINDLSYRLKRPSHRIQPFLRFREDLFLDIIDLKLLVADLEHRHGHFLTEEEAGRIETVGDLQQLFLRQMA